MIYKNGWKLVIGENRTTKNKLTVSHSNKEIRLKLSVDNDNLFDNKILGFALLAVECIHLVDNIPCTTLRGPIQILDSGAMIVRLRGNSGKINYNLYENKLKSLEE